MSVPLKVVETQLGEELEARVEGLVKAGLGLGAPPAAGVVAAVAGRLCGEDRAVAERAGVLVLGALWPDGSGGPPLRWWGTGLGVAVGVAVLGGAVDDVEVSFSGAAAVLGVARGTVSSLRHRGTLPSWGSGSGIPLSALVARRSALWDA